MKTFNATQLTQILGDCLQSPIQSDVIVCSISTDTRTISEGDTFVALSGERFDGHNYIDTAVESGARVVMVEYQQATPVPQIIVSNTRLALAKLATAIRNAFVTNGGKVVGLTGSVGKTTNKQMLASILAQVGKTHATKGNLNNELGVPFTWFDLPNDTQFAIIEMGANHQGEIEYLAKITQPQVAMITNAGQAHLEGFGGLDGVAKGKGELFANLRAGHTAVINLDDDYADYWGGLLAEGVVVKTFSLTRTDADVFATHISDRGTFTLNANGEAIGVTLPVSGRHNIMNALGCAACALSLNIRLSAIADGLSTFESAKGRLQTISIDNLTVIDDSYNANPTSMRASATILASSDGYKIMILGDMRELGDSATALHAQLGKDLHGKADTFLCLGDLMTTFAENNPNATHFGTLEALQNQLLEVLACHTKATVLVKGSRSMQMERVTAFLQEQLGTN